MKILTIIGTRPEAIKMAPLLLALEAHPRINSKLCVTAQHRALLDQVLEFFSLRPDHDLDVMSHSQGLGEVTARVLTGVGRVIDKETPDLVLVHGDTNTSMSAALASYYAKTDVGHVEAGLRTGNKYSPWPEEMNRRITGSIAALHFAPTEGGRQNLLREGVDESSIFVTGNTVVDALLLARQKLQSDRNLVASLDREFDWLRDDQRLILVTGHRRENFGAGFESIARALLRIAERPDVQVVYPVHPNPAVRGPIAAVLGDHPRIRLIDPVDYPAFVYLMMRCYLILTDSGGVQEEAPSLDRPVLVMRDTTERPEAVDAGAVRLVGADEDAIVAGTIGLLDDSTLYRRMADSANPFGDGSASSQIVQHLLSR